MADMKIEFDSYAAKEFFKGLSRNIEDITEGKKAYVNAISAFVFRDIIDHFKKEQGSEGKWKAWSRVYAQRMQRVGKGGNKILQDSGRLRNSFQPTQWKLKSKGIEWYNPAQTSGGFPYAYAHNEGGPVLPKRDFMWLSKGALDKISKLTAAWMLNGSKTKGA